MHTILRFIRQLDDRIEEYSKIIEGQCACGKLINKVVSSSCTMWKNGDIYHYPIETDAGCIFRCRKCLKPIHENFKENKYGNKKENNVLDYTSRKQNPYRLIWFKSDWSKKKTMKNNKKYWAFEIEHNGFKCH